MDLNPRHGPETMASLGPGLGWRPLDLGWHEMTP